MGGCCHGEESNMWWVGKGGKLSEKEEALQKMVSEGVFYMPGLDMKKLCGKMGFGGGETITYFSLFEEKRESATSFIFVLLLRKECSTGFTFSIYLRIIHIHFGFFKFGRKYLHREIGCFYVELHFFTSLTRQYWSDFLKIMDDSFGYTVSHLN